MRLGGGFAVAVLGLQCSTVVAMRLGGGFAVVAVRFHGYFEGGVCTDSNVLTSYRVAHYDVFAGIITVGGEKYL